MIGFRSRRLGVEKVIAVAGAKDAGFAHVVAEEVDAGLPAG